MSPKRSKAVFRMVLASLLIALSLTVVKYLYGRSTGSLAFIADAFHSLFDSIATLLGLLAVFWSNQPPDEAHPYGHDKFETLSALVLSLFLLFAAYEVGWMTYDRFHQPEVIPDFSFWGVIILVVVAIFNFGLSHMEKRLAKKTGSSFLASDAAHNQGDIAVTLTVLLTVVCSYFRIRHVDTIGCALITLYLFYVSAHVIWTNFKPLVDHRALDPREVETVAQSIDGVLHCHAIRSRGAHGRYFLDLNIHLPGQITLTKAHEITHLVESRLMKQFPGLVDVVIHTEPHDHPPCSKDS